MRIAHVTDCYLPRLGGIEMQVHDLRPPAQRRVTRSWSSRQTPARSRDGVPVTPHGRAAAALRTSPVHVRACSAGWSALTGPGDSSTWSTCRLASCRRWRSVRAGRARAGLPTVVTDPLLWTLDRHPGFAARMGFHWPTGVWSAVSERAAAAVRRIAGPGVAVEVLPNGIDNDAWRRQPAPRDPPTSSMMPASCAWPRASGRCTC